MGFEVRQVHPPPVADAGARSDQHQRAGRHSGDLQLPPDQQDQELAACARRQEGGR